MRSSLLSGLVLFGVSALIFAVPACGSTEDDKKTGDNTAGSAGAGKSGGGGSLGKAGSGGTTSSGGSGGSGGSAPQSVTCGTKTCNPKTIPAPGAPAVPACCPDKPNTCGLDLGQLAESGVNFDNPCQELDQPGTVDAKCPDSPAQMVSGFQIQFPGCCRAATNTCGYRVDTIAGIFQIGLGCVDPAPLAGASGAAGAPAAISCGSAGAGGSSGSSGAGGSSAGAGGASNGGTAGTSGGGTSGSAGANAGAGG